MSTTSADDYVVFCEGLRGLSGLDLSQYKRGQMERRLRTFAERLGIAGLTEYLALLRRDAAELEQLLDRVTINVSQLWRNPELWSMLAGSVIPGLAESGRIRIWSAGCSYGAECYTIAALCREQVPGVRLEIKGTDIDPRMLERARSGVFSEADARTVPSASLARWFERVEGGFKVIDELRKLTSFERADLLEMRVPSEKYDLVLCRNVVIYFNEEVRDQLHGRLSTSLRSGGYLVVGSTERIRDSGVHGLALAHPFTYRKA